MSRRLPGSARVISIAVLCGATMLGVGSCASNPSAAQSTTPSTVPATLPTAQQVIDRYVAVTGGAEAYGSIRSRRQVGSIEVPAQGVKGTTFSATTRPTATQPARGKIVSTLEGVGPVTQGFVGEVAYNVESATGARLLVGDEALAAIQQLTINAEIDLRGFASSSVTGVEEVRGKPCYRVELVTAGGQVVTRMYEVESGLLVRASSPLPSMGENVQAVVAYGDYQSAPPIKRPMFTRMQIGQPAILFVETRFTKVEHNVDLSDDELDPPAAVKDLMSATRPTR
jgi:hypothetical protein